MISFVFVQQWGRQGCKLGQGDDRRRQTRGSVFKTFASVEDILKIVSELFSKEMMGDTLEEPNE